MELLNKEPFIASSLNGGVNLIIAGAGTGKTKTPCPEMRSMEYKKQFRPMAAKA